MHAGNRQIMMIVMDVGEPVRQLALVVVIDIAEGGEALTVGSLFGAFRLKPLAQQIAHGL